jgi:glycosyl transferase family 25
MDKLGLDFSFVDAVDGRALTSNDLGGLGLAARRRYFTNELTPGEIGCFLSHRRVYEEIIATGAPVTVVLEDDAEVAPDFAALAESIAALPRFDLVWLCGAPKGKRYRNERRLTERYELVRPFETKSTTQGYVVSLAGAQKLAAHCARITDPIDIAVKRYWVFGGDVFNVLPAACKDFPGNTTSTIEGRIVLKDRRSAGLTAWGAFRRNMDELRKVGSFSFRMLNNSLGRSNAG